MKVICLCGGEELHVNVNFTMAGQAQLGGQLDPGINRGTREGFLKIKGSITNLVRANLVLIHNLDVELVLTGFAQVESEGLVPDGVIGVANDGSRLLVVIIDPQFTLAHISTTLLIPFLTLEPSHEYLHIGIVLTDHILALELTAFD